MEVVTMNKDDLKKIELDTKLNIAVEQFRRALQSMKDSYNHKDDLRIEPKGRTLYTVYNRDSVRR